MTAEGIFKKYLLIYRLLRKPYTYPSYPKLIALLQAHGIQVAQRTLERDVAALRAEFGLPIFHCRRRKGFYLAEEEGEGELSDANEFIKLLELSESVSEILHSYKDLRENKRHIFFSTNGSFKGSQLLPLINEAIKSSRWLEFAYQSYSNKKVRKREVIPCLLFEHKHRWYLLGRDQGKVKTFGLDRIGNIALLPQLFDRNEEAFDFKEYFRHTLGVTWYDKAPEEIVLAFNPAQAPYLQSLPLHPSQKIIKEEADAFVIQLKLVINYELKQEILGYGSRVKVLAPKHLAEEIQQEMKEAYKAYIK